MIWLADTDITNYLVKRREPTWSRYVASLDAGDSFALSPVVRFEVTRHLTLKGATRVRSDFDRLVGYWTPISLELSDWDAATDLWAIRHRARRPIEDANLLIAVCALKAGATLVTNNTRHYEGLGVPLENWAT